MQMEDSAVLYLELTLIDIKCTARKHSRYAALQTALLDWPKPQQLLRSILQRIDPNRQVTLLAVMMKAFRPKAAQGCCHKTAPNERGLIQ